MGILMNLRKIIKPIIPAKLLMRLRKLDNNKIFLTAFPEILKLFNIFRENNNKRIFIISLPRSGSSWIGSMIGAANNAVYLREPITQPYMQKNSPCPSFFELDRCLDKQYYKYLYFEALNGIPKYQPNNITFYPHQWKITKINIKKIVIKEVNPLIIDYIISEFEPYIIYLIRHPVDVANSFYAKGWHGEQFKSRYTNSSLSMLKEKYNISFNDDFYCQSGSIQAITQNIVMNVLKTYPYYTIVKYEDVCSDPFKVVNEVYNKLGLNFNNEIENIIMQKSFNDSDNPHLETNKRSSKNMIHKFRQFNLNSECVTKLKECYFINNPYFYLDNKDW